jgi:hypothetical protein
MAQGHVLNWVILAWGQSEILGYVIDLHETMA